VGLILPFYSKKVFFHLKEILLLGLHLPQEVDRSTVKNSPGFAGAF
jgi:hypothetical protein